MLLLHKLVVLLESLSLSVSSIPSTGLIHTAPAAHKVAPTFKIAAAVLPPTAVLFTWAILSSHHDAPRLIPATTLQVADHHNTLYPSVTFALVCSSGSYDGLDEGLRLVTGRCDVPYFFESPKPIAAKPSILAWPTCSLAAYDGPDLALRQENGVCDFHLPIFLPEPVPDAQTAHATLLLRMLGSLPSDPHQAIGHLSDRLRYIGYLLRAHRAYSIWQSQTRFSSCHSCTRYLGLAYTVPLRQGPSIQTTCWFVQTRILFASSSGLARDGAPNDRSRHQTQVSLIWLLVHVVEPISLLRLSTESLHTKVGWTPVLPLPQHLHRPVQLILVLVFVSSFYIDCRRLQVSLFSNTFTVTYIIYQPNFRTVIARRAYKARISSGTIVRLSFHFITSHYLPFFPNAQVENPTRSEHVPSTNEVDVCPEEAPWSTSQATEWCRTERSSLTWPEEQDATSYGRGPPLPPDKEKIRRSKADFLLASSLFSLMNNLLSFAPVHQSLLLSSLHGLLHFKPSMLSSSLISEYLASQSIPRSFLDVSELILHGWRRQNSLYHSIQLISTHLVRLFPAYTHSSYLVSVSNLSLI